MAPTVILTTAIVAGAASAALLVVGVGLPYSSRERIQRTLAAFGTRRPQRHDASAAFTGVRLRSVVHAASAALGAVLTSTGTRRRLGRLIDYAGNPPAWPIHRVVRTRGQLFVAGLPIGGLLGAVLLGPDMTVPGIVAGALFGVFLPDLLLHNAGTKRQGELVKSLPDVLDALVISVEAGLGLDAAMAQVSDNLRGPMPNEIHRVLQEMKLGVARSDALRALSTRTTVPELKGLVTALVQSGELGVPVAGVLREHAREQRVRRRQRAEEAAQKVPIKLLFPVLFCLFPVMFVVILGPAILRMADTFGS